MEKLLINSNFLKFKRKLKINYDLNNIYISKMGYMDILQRNHNFRVKNVLAKSLLKKKEKNIKNN
jgi:hypothetical protein